MQSIAQLRIILAIELGQARRERAVCRLGIAGRRLEIGTHQRDARQRSGQTQLAGGGGRRLERASGVGEARDPDRALRDEGQQRGTVLRVEISVEGLFEDLLGPRLVAQGRDAPDQVHAPPLELRRTGEPQPADLRLARVVVAEVHLERGELEQGVPWDLAPGGLLAPREERGEAVASQRPATAAQAGPSELPAAGDEQLRFGAGDDVGDLFGHEALELALVVLGIGEGREDGTKDVGVEGGCAGVGQRQARDAEGAEPGFAGAGPIDDRQRVAQALPARDLGARCGGGALQKAPSRIGVAGRQSANARVQGLVGVRRISLEAQGELIALTGDPRLGHRDARAQKAREGLVERFEGVVVPDAEGKAAVAIGREGPLYALHLGEEHDGGAVGRGDRQGGGRPDAHRAPKQGRPVVPLQKGAQAVGQGVLEVPFDRRDRLGQRRNRQAVDVVLVLADDALDGREQGGHGRRGAERRSIISEADGARAHVRAAGPGDAATRACGS